MNTTSIVPATLTPPPTNTLREKRRGHSARALRHRRGLVAWSVFVILMVAALTYPLWTVFAEAAGDLPGVLVRATQISDIGTVFLNTVVLAVGAVVVALVLGVTLAGFASRLEGKALSIGMALGVAPMLLPALSAISGWIILFSPTVGYGNQLLRSIPLISDLSGPTGEGPVDVYSMPWIVGISGVYTTPFIFMFVATALRQLDPSIEAAARASGATWLRTQLTIVLPAIRPALVYSSIIVLLLALGQFAAPLLLGQGRIEVVTTLMFKLSTADIDPDRPLAALLAVPFVLLAFALVAFQRSQVGSLAKYSAAGKGVAYTRKPSRAALIPIVAFALITLVPPVLALIAVSLQPYWSGVYAWDAVTGANYAKIFKDPRLFRALTNTVVYGAAATLIALILTFALSKLLMQKTMPRLRLVADYVVNLPIAVPALIFGFGVFLAFGVGLGWLGSPWLFVIPWVILVVPHGVRILLSAQSQMGTSVLDAARVSGSSALHAQWSILIPLLRRSFAAAATLMFVLISQEFAAASLVRTSTNQVLATFMYEQWLQGSYPLVAVVALIMAAVAAAGVSLSAALGGLKSRN